MGRPGHVGGGGLSSQDNEAAGGVRVEEERTEPKIAIENVAACREGAFKKHKCRKGSKRKILIKYKMAEKREQRDGWIKSSTIYMFAESKNILTVLQHESSRI